MVTCMGEITIRTRIPKELEGFEREIEKIIKKRIEDTIRQFEALKNLKG